MGQNKDTPLTGEERYPIRTVSQLTGVNAITLRAWERRYGLIQPLRTETGHRVYTGADVATVHRILTLVGQGVAIGQVRQVMAAQSSGEAASDQGPWAQARSRLLAALAQFDDERLEAIYSELLLPLLVDLGLRWRDSRSGIAEEHFFGVFLRNKLGARLHHRSRSAVGPKLLLACLPGEHHEIGLLLFALAAHERGYRVLLFGANMPLDQMAHAARRAQGQGIVFSGSIEPEAGALTTALPALVREAGVPVFVGGPTSVRACDAIRAAGAVPLGSDIGVGLRHIGTHLAGQGGAQDPPPR